MARSMFQYIRSVYVRWRVFKVYIAPIIEWYLPTIAHLPKHLLAKNNPLESFQHKILSMVTGVARTCSTKELCEAVAEMPVGTKLQRLGARMAKYIHRDFIEIYVGDQKLNKNMQRMTLRTGKSKGHITWRGADKRDLGDMLYMLKHLYKDNQGKNVFVRDSAEYIPFDIEYVKKWTKDKNAEIAKIIYEKSLGLRD